MQSDSVIPPIPKEPVEPETVGRAFGRVLNIIAAPGEVYEEWTTAKLNFANIFIPALLVIVASIIFTFTAFSQPAIISGLREAQDKQLAKSSTGLTAQQIQQQQEFMDKFMTPTVLKVVGIAGGAIGVSLGLVAEGLIVWGLLQFVFKTRVPFLKSLELTGLSFTPLVLGSFITLGIVLMTSNLLLNAGPSLLVKNFDGSLKLHQVLSVLNLMTMWQLGVEAVGISKLSRKPFLPVLLVTLTLWLSIRCLMIFGNPKNYQH